MQCVPGSVTRMGDGASLVCHPLLTPQPILLPAVRISLTEIQWCISGWTALQDGERGTELGQWDYRVFEP